MRDRHPYGPRPAHNRVTLPSGGAWLCEASASASEAESPQSGARPSASEGTPKYRLERRFRSPSARQLCAVEVPFDGFSGPAATARAQEVKARERGSGQIFDENVSFAFVEARGTVYRRLRICDIF